MIMYFSQNIHQYHNKLRLNMRSIVQVSLFSDQNFQDIR